MNNTPRGFIKCGWAFGCYAFRVLDGSTQQSPKSVEIVFPHWLRKCYACLTHSSVTSSMTDASGAPHSRLRTRNMSTG